MLNPPQKKQRNFNLPWENYGSIPKDYETSIYYRKKQNRKKHGTIPKRLKFLNKYVEAFKQA